FQRRLRGEGKLQLLRGKNVSRRREVELRLFLQGEVELRLFLRGNIFSRRGRSCCNCCEEISSCFKGRSSCSCFCEERMSREGGRSSCNCCEEISSREGGGRVAVVSARKHLL